MFVVVVDGTKPVRVEQLIDAVAARRPDHPALIDGARRWTYAQLRDEMDRRAAILVDAGVPSDAVVLTTGPVNADVVLAFLACCRANTIFFHISPKLTPAELRPLIARASPHLILTRNGQPHAAAAEIFTLPSEMSGNPDAYSTMEARRRSASGNADATAALETTSSTTGGTSKLVRVAHRRLTLRHNAPLWWESSDDVLLIPQPNVLTISGVCNGFGHGQTVVLSDALDPLRIETELARHSVTILRGVPALVYPLITQERPVPPGLSLRVVRTGTAFLPITTQHGIIARYGARVVQEYGSTESGLVIGTPPGGAPEGSIGKPYTGVEARIVTDDGMDVTVGEIGELIIRSPSVMVGYLDDPAAMARALRDGWLWTGDLARCDADGCYFLEGRASLRINVGGFKVAPEEVEAVLQSHPHVREAVILARPDAARGEVVRAVIVPEGKRPTVAELRRYCRTQLAAYKVPRQWEFRDDLPRSLLGKVLRRQLD